MHFTFIYPVNATTEIHQVAAADAIWLAAMLITIAILGSFIGARLTHIFPTRVLQIVFMDDSRYAGNASSPGISSRRPDVSRMACAQREVESAINKTLYPICR